MSPPVPAPAPESSRSSRQVYGRWTALSAAVAAVCEVVAGRARPGGAVAATLIIGMFALVSLMYLLLLWALPVVVRPEHDLTLDRSLLTGTTLARGTRTVDLSALAAVDSRSLYSRYGGATHYLRLRSAEGQALILPWGGLRWSVDGRTEHARRLIRAACLRQLPVVHDRTKALLDVGVAQGGPGLARRMWVSSLSVCWWALWFVPFFATLIGYMVWPISRTSS